MPGLRRCDSQPHPRSPRPALPGAVQRMRFQARLSALGGLHRLPSPHLERCGIEACYAGSLSHFRAGGALQELPPMHPGIRGLARRFHYGALPHLPGAALLHRLDRSLPRPALVGSDARPSGTSMKREAGRPAPRIEFRTPRPSRRGRFTEIRGYGSLRKRSRRSFEYAAPPRNGRTP